VQKRRLFSSSGRFRAWRGAIQQADQRAIAGYGFGTEGDVFANRYYGFDSNLAENSYVGLYLQLGLAGLILLAVLLVVLLAPALRIRDGDAFAAALAVVVAGLVLGVGQSFLYSVGATGTLPFWICAFLASARAPKAA
jgi:O-antigen ligase